MSSQASEPARKPSKRLVLDANILIRAVLGEKVFTLLDEFASSVEFITAAEAFNDARRYLPEILEKRGLPKGEIALALEALGRLAIIVTPVPEEAYVRLEEAARKRLGSRDEEDWPFVALSLLFDCPIWTEDRDFFGSGIPTWTSDRVRLYLEA